MTDTGAAVDHDGDVEPLAVADEAPAPIDPPRTAARFRAVVQVLACSGVPTQLLLVQLLALAGVRPFVEGDTLNATWVFVLSLADTVLLLLLIGGLLVANGESIRGVFLGTRVARTEIPLGLVSVVPVLLIAAAVLLAAQYVAPWLHNVPTTLWPVCCSRLAIDGSSRLWHWWPAASEKKSNARFCSRDSNSTWAARASGWS